MEILKVAVKPDSYLVDGKRETLADVISMLETFKGKGFEICLEFEASQERLEAITDRIREIEFKRKSFISARECN